MKKEDFDSIEGLCEEITASVNAIEEWLDDIKPRSKAQVSAVDNIRKELSNIPYFKDRIYGVCENDYCESKDTEDLSQYNEIIAILPSGKLSLGEMLSLKEHVNQWKTENGYSTTNERVMI